MNHFPISDTSDSPYSDLLVKHSLPPYLGQPCSFAFTVDNDEVIFKGKFVNPATHSDLLVSGIATLRTPFCVFFSDEECKRYSTTQANKTVKLSHKIDLITAIIAHVSIHDMLGLDSLAPHSQVQASFKETIKLVHPDKNNGVVVCGESQKLRNSMTPSLFTKLLTMQSRQRTADKLATSGSCAVSLFK